jgi:hypothetical protein
VLSVVLGIVIGGAMGLEHRISANPRSIRTLSLEIQVTDIDEGKTWHIRNIFIKGKEIDCHASPVIHLLRYISCHPFIPGSDPYLVAINL